jgi:hypothetical protein
VNKFLGQAATFLLGVLIGVLGSFAAFSGRVAVVETNTTFLASEMSEMKQEVKTMNDQIMTLLRK